MKNARLNGQVASAALFIESEICLLELTGSGTILSCRNSQNHQFNQTPKDFIGRNLFEEVTPYDNTEELRRRLVRFLESEAPWQKFTFDCRFKDKVFPAKIMLVRVGSRTTVGNDQRLIVDIRKQ